MSECCQESFPLLGITVYLPSLGCSPIHCLLITVPGMEIAQILIWTSMCSCLIVHSYQNQYIFLCGRYQLLFKYSIDSLTSWSCGFKVQLVYSLWEVCICFLSCFPWLSSVVLFLPFHAAWPLGFASEAELEDLGLPKVGPGVEVE